MSKSKSISVRLDDATDVVLSRECELAGTPRNRVINRAVVLYYYLAQLQRSYKDGSVNEKAFMAECHRLLDYITTEWR